MVNAVGSGSGSGNSSGSSSASSSASSSVSNSSGGSSSGSACTPGAQQCSDSAHIETCSSTGQWGDVWACSTGSCSNGACEKSDGGSPPPSCQTGDGGVTDCLAAGGGTESCCTSLEVAGGTFYRTYTNTGGGPNHEADPATVSGFRLDKYLVTVGRFRQFVSAWNGGAGYLPAAGSGKHTHLNGGQGLVNVGDGGGYESGWVASNDGNVAPTNANLACENPATWTDAPGNQENLPITCITWQEA